MPWTQRKPWIYSSIYGAIKDEVGLVLICNPDRHIPSTNCALCTLRSLQGFNFAVAEVSN